jgi:predicted TIM-barrel fold metal-dependent hydrolase
VKFILAHWGGRLWRAGGAWPANVWVDTAAAPLLYTPDAGIWTEGMEAAGAGRVLWGSDYPLVLYPKTGESETLPGFLAEARASVSSEAQEAVLGGNAARILRVGFRQ